MRKFMIFPVLLIGALFAAQTQAPTQGPKSESPRGQAEFKLNDGKKIVIDYGRPRMNGRKIMGEVVPYEKVWRTGDGAATAFATGAELNFSGIKVPAGNYTLYTIPDKTSWTIIINRQTGQSGAIYEQSKDLVRVKAKPVELAQVVDPFTISFDKRSAERGVMKIAWEKTAVPVEFVAPPPSGCDLDKILKQMDATAASFRSAEANFEWDQFTKVIEEHDTQKGTVFFRRNGNEIQMAADIAQHNGVAEQKNVLFTNGKVEVYQPKIDQVTLYNAGKNRSEFESFLVLGFGGSGKDLVKQFDVRCEGMENVMGVNTAKLLLTPKAAKVRSMFSHIILWIDPTRGVSVQQQFLDEISGDYRIAKYSDIKLNQKISDSAFRLKTTSKTRYVTPQG